MITLFHTINISGCLKVLFIAVVLIGAGALTEGGESIAQEKNKFERLNERKNKSNRRKSRRGDKGKSNKAKLRAAKFKSRTRQGEKSYKGDITGRRVVTKTTKRVRSRANYAQPNPYAGRRRKTEARVAKKVLSSPKYTQRKSESAKKASANPRFSNRQRERAWKGGINGRAIGRRSKRITFTGNKRYGGSSARSVSRPSERRITGGRIVPRSSSGAYNVRRKRSPYSSFRPRKSWEKAFKGDITGRTFRTKRTTEKPIIQSQPKTRYSRKGTKGDNAFKGSLGGYKSATRTPERAWRKDISGKKLRIRTSKGPNFSGGQFEPYPKSKNRRGDRAFKGKIKGGGYESISSRKEQVGKPNNNRQAPGVGTRRALSFQGNIKSSKPLKGGGSISGKRWNNNGQSTTRVNNSEQSRRVRGFQGTLKASKPLKGGGSISGIRWNNKGQSVTKANNTEQSRRVRSFQGNIKTSKPLKGGGSIARNNWNNKGQSVTKPRQSLEGRRASGFTGNVKLPIRGKYDALAGTYKGAQKRKFKYKKNPNAADDALKVKQDFKNDRLAGNFKGRTKDRSNYKKNPAAADEALKKRGPNKNYYLGGNFQGRSKVTWNYKQNPSAAEESLKNRPPSTEARKGSNFQGRNRVTWNYKQNPSAADESLKNRPPSAAAKKGSNFQGRTRITWNYKKNPGSAKESLKGIAPSKETARGTRFQGNVRLATNYKKKPHAADNALKGRAPSKAAISAANYQGNIKMSKRSLEDRHPSLRYARGRNSATQEKEKLFSFKLLFSKLFKKNESQPSNVKDKEPRPRFDKRERDIWYE